MRILRMVILLIFVSMGLKAESFYVLTDVKSYDQLVITEGKELESFNKDIKSLMNANAWELDINTRGQSSRVLAFIILKFSVGDTIGVRVILELGEYVRRKGSEDEVFAITYIKEKVFTYDKEELEDDLADTVEEMLEAFAIQYRDDNKKFSDKRKGVTHETFAKDMGYEDDYKVALAKAKKEGKDLMVFMSSAYCPWCRKLESRILSQKYIDQKMKTKHVPVLLNHGTKKFPKSLEKIKVVPTLYIIDAKTERIKETFIGFSSRKLFLNYLGR